MSKKSRIFCVVAARPNFMKVAPILVEMERSESLQAILVHTGQHYDANMSEVFFRDLGISEPDVHLGIGSGTHAEQTGYLMMAFEKLCQENRPDMVLVMGDVNATAACSLVASKLQIPVAHVEAGLRSGDRRMPEEINRLVTDTLSDILFTTSRDADKNLFREGVDARKIHFTGNVMVDSLLANLDRVNSDEVIMQLLGKQFLEKDYSLMTMHRPSNVDEEPALYGWVRAFEKISKLIPIICPLHPRTKNRLESFQLIDRFTRAVKVTSPMGYLEFIGVMRRARLVMTDSGGLQEEATVLGVPCLTIRENTERPVTITNGTNQLTGIKPALLIEAVSNILKEPIQKETPIPELWDGRAAHRIVRILERELAKISL